MPRMPPFFMRLRFATAAIATWLMNLNVFGLSIKSVCTPGFNCHGCPWATAACPIGVMACASAMRTIPVLAIASVLAVGAVLGRIVCSFLCPFGLLQDLLHRIPSPKLRLPGIFRYGKYLLLASLVFILPYLLGFSVDSGYLVIGKPEVNKGEGGQLDIKVAVTNGGTEPVVSPQLLVLYKTLDGQNEVFRDQKTFTDVTVPPGSTLTLPAFQVPNQLSFASLELQSPQSHVRQSPRYQLYFCKLCPAGTLTSTIPGFFLGSAAPSAALLRLAILAGFLALMVLASRPFCRLACPLGAIYGLTARWSISGMRLDRDACIDCGQCDKVCPMELDVRRELGRSECIACGDCRKACPRGGIHRTLGL